MQDLPQNNTQQQETSFREHLEIYLRQWPWYVVCVLIALSIAFIYLRYTPTTYIANASILIKNEGKSELAAFKDMGLVDMMNISDFANEMVVLNSKSLSERVVEELNLTVSYYREGSIRDAEIFDYKPFEVRVISPSDENRNVSGTIYIKPISSVQFNLKNGSKGDSKVYNFGELINLGWTTLLVTPNVELLKRMERDDNFVEIRVSIRNKDAVASAIRAAINVGPLNERSSVVKLTMTSNSPEKARAVLDELIEQYNKDSMNDRNQIARNTADFIQGRLEIITEELDSVEIGKVEFKESNRLTDLVTESGIFLQNANEAKQKELAIETQIALVNTMMDYLKNSSKTDLLPSNLAGGEEGFAPVVDRYNELIMERNRLLQSSTTKNPLVVGLDEQISEVRANVMESMLNAKQSLRITLGELNNEKSKIGSKIHRIPSQEKDFRSISRQQEIKESLYLYLLQKREENAIALAVTSPRAKVVDNASSRVVPVKKQVVIIAALVIGLLLPLIVIYLHQLLDNKIRSRAFVERNGGDIAIVGEIPELDKKQEDIIQSNDTSILAESFRILSTNLKYLVLDKLKNKERGKTIFVTSTVKGEGKTFVSANLAVTLANGGSKVVLVGADIRNPQLQRYIPGEYKNSGVVEYLVYPNTTTEEYIQPSNMQNNLWLMVSGTIPPNPAELWMQDRAGTLFDELATQFDYIIVDTAPAMLVTDTLLINKYADVTIYTLRAGYTEKNLLSFALDNKNNGKLKNIAFVLNNVAMTNFGYGNKYGYSYGQNKKSFWDKLFRR